MDNPPTLGSYGLSLFKFLLIGTGLIMSAIRWLGSSHCHFKRLQNNLFHGLHNLPPIAPYVVTVIRSFHHPLSMPPQKCPNSNSFKCFLPCSLHAHFTNIKSTASFCCISAHRLPLPIVILPDKPLSTSTASLILLNARSISSKTDGLILFVQSFL